MREKNEYTWRFFIWQLLFSVNIYIFSNYILFSFPWCIGAVLLSSVQGLAINVDPVLYTWLIYQPQKRPSRHIQQVCILGVEGVERGKTFSCMSTSSAFLFHVFLLPCSF